MSPVVLSWANLYCLRFPNQRGFASGLNSPMYTWFKNVPWVFTLTGREADTNTLFTACTSFRSFRMASAMAWGLDAATKAPPPLPAALLNSSIILWSEADGIGICIAGVTEVSVVYFWG